MTIAIDGPAGTGKSTVASKVAGRAGFLYLNSGAFYRAITWSAIERHVRLADSEKLSQFASKIQMSLDSEGISVDGYHPAEQLRSQEVESNVATVSSIPAIREIVNARLHELAEKSDVVAEGRDMSTVVFPNADVKVYLDATIEARAKRRHSELESRASYEEIRDAIAERDRIDKNKRVGRLKVDPAALYINTSDLTLDQVCEMVFRAILRKNQDNRSI